MEGISGTISWEDFEQEHTRYRRLMTNEVVAAIEGIKDSAVPLDEILVCDSHGKMNNLYFEDLPKGILVNRGVPRPYGMVEGVDSSFDSVFLLGHHPKAGTPFAPMDHSFSSSSFYNLKVNGIEVSEALVNAAFAGHFGVPVGLVTGEVSLIEQLKEFLPPGVEFVVTKWGLSRFAAKVRHPKDVEEEIKNKAQKAATKCKEIQPFLFKSPLSLEIDLMDTLRADLVSNIPGMERIGGRTVSYSPKDMVELVKVLRLSSILATAGAKIFK